MSKTYSDQELAKQLRFWVDRLEHGEQGWDRPDWLRQTLAALLVGQTIAGFDEIEHKLMCALNSRLKYRAGEPPDAGDERVLWREQAYIDTRDALAAMSSEQPYLTGRKYVEAVTGPRQPAQG